MKNKIKLPHGTLSIDANEFVVIDDVKNEQASKLWKDTFDNDNYVTGRKDFVVGPAILIKKKAQKIWAR
jgi:hypothetical protein